jgi:hypothetical protein
MQQKVFMKNTRAIAFLVFAIASAADAFTFRDDTPAKAITITKVHGDFNRE